MIDLHNHLLPGVDDGASSMASTRLLLARSVELGYRTIVATPHLHVQLAGDYRLAVETRLAEVRHEAGPYGISVIGGYEVFLSPDLPRRLEAGEPSTIAGTWAILVELPFVGWPTYTEATMFALQAAGYRPILAHPERYRAVQEQPDLAIALARRGVQLQLTLQSLTGSSRRIQKVSTRLLEAGAITLVASDAHGDDHRLAAVPDALRRLEQIVGRERRDRIVNRNPVAILSGDDIALGEQAGEGDFQRRPRRWWPIGRGAR